MRGKPVLTVLVVLTVTLAGCATSGPGTGGTTTAAPGTTAGGGGGSGTGGTSAGTASVDFYVSDAPIDDFEHLNVTVTKIGFQKAGSAGDDEADENETEAPETETEEPENETEEPEPTGTPEPTETPDNETTETPEPTDTPENVITVEPTETPVTAHVEPVSVDLSASQHGNATNATTETPETPENESEDGDDGDRAGWVEHEVDNVTVDLTELRGTNATLIGSPEIPAGDYNKVFIHVSSVEGVLKDGTTVNVKLPSQKLHLNKQFTAGPNETVTFVYDLSVHKAGKSGKYILKPVVSQSGAGKAVNPVGPRGGPPENAGPGSGAGSGNATGGQGGNGGQGGPAQGGGPDNGGPPNGSQGQGGPPEERALEVRAI